MIYKALLKYGYAGFKLDILEYCDSSVQISREQYYIDLLKPEYNILKVAGSLRGFKHSEKNIERIRLSKLGRKRTEEEKLKIANGSVQSRPVIITNNINGKIIEVTSIRKASKFIDIHHSYIAKCLSKQKIYKGKEYNVMLL
jgi:hypothetical protein